MNIRQETKHKDKKFDI